MTSTPPSRRSKNTSRYQVGGAEVFQQGRRGRVEGGEDQALVDVELGHGDEAPLGLVKLVVVGVLKVGDGL